MPPIPDVVQFVIDVTQEVPANVSFWDNVLAASVQWAVGWPKPK
jgi:hypothetical protein